MTARRSSTVGAFSWPSHASPYFHQPEKSAAMLSWVSSAARAAGSINITSSARYALPGSCSGSVSPGCATSAASLMLSYSRTTASPSGRRSKTTAGGWWSSIMLAFFIVYPLFLSCCPPDYLAGKRFYCLGPQRCAAFPGIRLRKISVVTRQLVRAKKRHRAAFVNFAPGPQVLPPRPPENGPAHGCIGSADNEAHNIKPRAAARRWPRQVPAAVFFLDTQKGYFVAARFECQAEGFQRPFCCRPCRAAQVCQPSAHYGNVVRIGHQCHNKALPRAPAHLSSDSIYRKT